MKRMLAWVAIIILIIFACNLLPYAIPETSGPVQAVGSTMQVAGSIADRVLSCVSSLVSLLCCVGGVGLFAAFGLGLSFGGMGGPFAIRRLLGIDPS